MGNDIQVTPEYLNRAELWLLITMLAYFLMNGAQVFETMVIIPKWTSRPPESLIALQGPYAPDLKTFWIIAHSIHEITFIVAIILCWKIPQARLALLILFGIHFAVRLWTIGYFAPNIMTFQNADLNINSSEIQTAVSKWKNLNYLRVGLFLVLSLGVALVFTQIHYFHSSNVKTNMTMKLNQRLSVITLGVDNLPAQTNFYKTKLG